MSIVYIYTMYRAIIIDITLYKKGLFILCSKLIGVFADLFLLKSKHHVANSSSCILMASIFNQYFYNYSLYV